MRAAALAGAALTLAACGRVQPGYVGIKVNNFGTNQGVQAEALPVGWYFTGFGTHIVEYPVFTQTYTFSKNPQEGNANNEEFDFQDKSGLPMSGDIGVMYHADPEKVSILFQKFRVGQDQIVAGALRNAIRDSLINEASQLDVNDIYGAKKAEILADVQTRVQAYFAPYGLVVERLFWAGTVRMPDNVMEQINNRIANEQQALAEQAKVATVQAQAQQAAAEAKGKADALNIEGAAIRANPEVLRIRAIEKWDGHLPQVTSGGTPFISLDNK
jgi:regulator of protease activity HflC (stomatin/prohibitin superfamily)